LAFAFPSEKSNVAPPRIHGMENKTLIWEVPVNHFEISSRGRLSDQPIFPLPDFPKIFYFSAL
jgi:hypothetical protein